MKLISVLLLSAALAATAAVPTPESHFGHKMAEDRKLLEWSKIVSYFQSLEKSSDKIRYREYGKSTEGRPMFVGIISSADTLKKLDRYREIQARLADPRKTLQAEADALTKEGKTVVLITCSIHSTEVVSTLTAVDFAYRMLTSESPKIKTILDNTILLLAPSINPDGNDIVTNWYRKTLNTPHEGTAPPELYQKYVGHDNNRDWYIFSQAETRAVISQLHNVWHPHIVYDVHQQGATSSRMFVPPWMDPVDPNIDPVITQLCNAVGMNMAADLTSAGLKGIAVNAMYDFWHPGRHYQAYHGGLRILSESASARLATPVEIKPEQIQGGAQGYSPREASWNFLEPWMGGRWAMSDIHQYQMIAFESVLYQAAMRREDFLKASYLTLKRSVERAGPAAFVIPKEQANPGGAKKMLETLAFGGIEIDVARDNFQAEGVMYPAGSYIVRMDQPYSGWAKTLLEHQKYPDLRLYPGGPPKRPYDVTAHTLPLLMGVNVKTVAAKFDAKTQRMSGAPAFPAVSANWAASDVDSWRKANAAWKAGTAVYRSKTTGEFATAAVSADYVKVARPKVALYKSHMPSMDEGWTRWMLEEFGFAYTSLGNAEVIGGGLKAKYDVILFADQQSAAIAEGYRKGAMPDEYTGGLGAQGAAALKDFANAGGTLLFLNHSTDYAVNELGVKARNVLKGVSNREFYCPGSLLRVSLDPKHPLSFGLPKDLTIWNEASPAWDGFEGATAVASYLASNVMASGWLLGEKYVAQKAALVDVAMGRGRAILFGFRPQYRAQSYETFKILFNAFLL
ncbi:peptidase [Bryobacterales bacterium F-183]|nr:peptidase [Bryobacterales bacterium F-183]